MKSQLEKCEVFSLLHQQDQAFIIPNPWDIGTAKLLQCQGYKALATTSSGLAYTLGRADGYITLEETLTHCTALARSTNIPISADFENGFASTLMTVKKQFNCQVITQIDKATTVKSIYCFGKKHRPDMTLDENGIAIELKFITYAGLKDAIGQGYLYRLRYRFVFLVLIISEDRKSIYEDLCTGKEKDLEDTLQHLADNMNIFTYIVPAFNLKLGIGMKKCQSYFEPINA